MRTITGLILAGGVVGLVAAAAATGSRPSLEIESAPIASAVPASPTPAESAMAAARTRIERNPSRFESYNELAMALARRARETADPSFYIEAASTLAEARRLGPGNLESDRVEVWLLLGRHEFGPAFEKAKALNKRVPDDVMTYGMLVDASVELGRYAEAEDAAQWMLNMRPGTVPGLTRAAYLRELFGDIEGSLELMRMAIDRVPSKELEERAWILTQMSHLELAAGQVGRAQQNAEAALRLFPGYHYALAALADVYDSSGNHRREADLLAARYRAAPHPENLFRWAAALLHAGRGREARQHFDEFERQARQEIDSPDNANRELAQYYTDYANRPAEAVRIMERELTRRRDLMTLDAYAWALFKTGRRDDARRVIAEVLAVGTLDRSVRKHADAILGSSRAK